MFQISQKPSCFFSIVVVNDAQYIERRLFFIRRDLEKLREVFSLSHSYEKKIDYYERCLESQGKLVLFSALLRAVKKIKVESWRLKVGPCTSTIL